MAQFLIEYLDPQTGQWRRTVQEFNDTPLVPAEAWAQEWAWSRAVPTGRYSVKCFNQERSEVC